MSDNTRKVNARRNFLKQGFGFATAGIVLPNLGLTAFGQGDWMPFQTQGRKVLVVIEFSGANDGLNTVIPYTDPAYLRARPNLALTEKDGIIPISDKYALHPELAEIKALYDAKRVAIVHGVGYPNPNLSHFRSRDIWHTADPVNIASEGWLGKSVEVIFGNNPGLGALSVTNELPKTLASNDAVVPVLVPPPVGRGANTAVPEKITFPRYNFQTDERNAADGRNQLQSFQKIHGTADQSNPLAKAIAEVGDDAVTGALTLTENIDKYKSDVVYPAGNPLAVAMKALAQLIVTSPDTRILYASMGGFDTHARQIMSAQQKTQGEHATLLKYFSEAVDAFYKDLDKAGMADQVVILQWSEFGRRVGENGSMGTDHGTSAPLFVIGNSIKGGIYGDQPSLTTLDASGGNMRFNVDFRSVYATILDGWLGTSSQQVLGGTFENVGFFL